MNFYKIGIEFGNSDRWFLDQPVDESGQEVVAGRFSLGRQWDASNRLRSWIRNPGRPVAFSLGGLGDYFVKKTMMDMLIGSLPAGTVQAVPVAIDGIEEPYEILNVLDIVDCVDEARTGFSMFPRWTEEDGRPDKVGDYRIDTLRIDPARAAGHDLFRVKGWLVGLVCSERIRDLLIELGVTGIRFTAVS
ncbi:imm11 family protein [Cupriavidus numazuensis]|uniref:Uncharacterized protein n=1 Tax=Cupriavidus numazuensis TaxID=221992 RepID=A0ABM8TJ29_9BURK|nr:DUF1629 domain-containing protein [Cupriavidus numazuensis]CAG2149637.1 hypothetical protein LMG26411_03588 [Cupriavidus numazuensis]